MTNPDDDQMKDTDTDRKLKKEESTLANDALNHPGLAGSLSNEDLEKLVIPDKNRAPPMLNSELVERLADLVVERVMAKFESASLARRRSGVRISPAPHLPSKSTGWGYNRQNRNSPP